MGYNKLIETAEKNLESLKSNREKFRKVLRTLSIGDIIHVDGVYDDFFPQIIEKIDVEKCKIFTYEKSINKSQWITRFYIADPDGKLKLIN